MSTTQDTTPARRLSYRVVPLDGVWKVALPGDSVPASFHARREDAISAAVRLARKDGADVVICNAEGAVETELRANDLR